MRSPRPSPRRDLTAEILTISVVVALFVLFGVAMLWALDRSGFRLAPTPTATATARPSATSTPDVVATQNAEDMLTQVAYAATLVFRLTPGQYPTDLPYAEQATTIANLPVVIVPNLSPTPNPLAPPAPPETITPAPISTAVYMPVVTNPEPTPEPLSPTETPLTPEPFATWTATPITPLPMTPSPTPFVPTPTATFQVVQPTATSTPAPFGEYYATVNRSGSTAIYPGPSNGYSALGSFSQGGSMRVFGRTVTGDWLYGCCVPNSSTSQNFWIRRAYVTISPPSGADAEDVKPLPVATVDPSLGARPAPTSIPLGDFPLARFDSFNSGRVPNLPGTDLRYVWPISPQATSGFSSPAAVRGDSVYVASKDLSIYELDRVGGNQRWRFNIGNEVNLAPTVHDDIIYLVFGTIVTALQDLGNSYQQVWQTSLSQNITAAPNIWNDLLFVSAGEGADARLIALRRQSPSERREFNLPESRIYQPAIAQETVFVGANRVWAVDANMFNVAEPEVVWMAPEVTNVVAPPVYAAPGVVRLSELYVADSNDLVWALDATTGKKIWAKAVGVDVTAMAVNDDAVFVAGSSGGSTYVRKLRRSDGADLWSVAPGGVPVMGGPLVTADRMLIALLNGVVIVYDVNTGSSPAARSVTLPSALPERGGPAVSDNLLIVPAANNNAYALSGQ